MLLHRPLHDYYYCHHHHLWTFGVSKCHASPYHEPCRRIYRDFTETPLKRNEIRAMYEFHRSRMVMALRLLWPISRVVCILSRYPVHTPLTIHLHRFACHASRGHPLTLEGLIKATSSVHRIGDVLVQVRP